MKVPLLDLKAEYNFLKKEISLNLKRCLSSQEWILGSLVSEFEKTASHYLGSKYAVGVASGTDALLIGLRALAIELKNKDFFNKKDEIITTPFTFVASAEAIIRAGAKPVFVDIDSNSFNISPPAIEKAITKNTVGILPVHIYGQTCNMGAIQKIARKNNLFVLEDCAQSFGASCQNKKLGTWGEVGAFSFFPSKNLGGFGDAGLITAKSKKIFNLIKILRNHGQTAPYRADYCGYNSRLDSIQAAVLLAKIKHIDKFNRRRAEIAKKYNEALSGFSQVQIPCLSASSKAKSKNLSHIYHLYTIKVSSGIRDELVRGLNLKGVLARTYYPVSLDRMRAFKVARVAHRLENTQRIVKEVVSLPVYPFMDNKKVDYSIDNIKKVLLSLSTAKSKKK